MIFQQDCRSTKRLPLVFLHPTEAVAMCVLELIKALKNINTLSLNPVKQVGEVTVQ